MTTIHALLNDARWRRAWRVLLVLLLVTVCWLAFMPNPPDNELPSGDKINHLLAFGTLAVTARFASAPGPRRAAIAAAGLLLYGGFIELVQTQLPYRSGEWADLLADAVGIASGLVVAALLRHWRPAAA